MIGRGGTTVDLDNWIPLRWACGPLEIERGKRRETFTARESEALRAWTEPGALDLLSGSPVSCLVVIWADGSAGDEDHQRALAPLVAAARQRGLSVVGWVSATADLRRAVATAQATGLAALATDSADPVPGFDVLRFRKRGFDHRPPSDFLGDLDAVWPGMKMDLKAGVDAVSGPTGAPWLDSNGWYVRLARSLVNPRTLWLAFEPSDLGQPLPATAYVQAIADTEAHGARWMVSLDPHLRVGLLDRRAAALDTWATIGRSLAFFRTHRAWTGFAPAGQLGVVSDYTGTNEFLSFEMLNLLARQGSLYRILEKGAALQAPFAGLDAVVYVDEAPPVADLVRKLYAFAEAGGTLVTPEGWEERGVLEDDAWPARFRIFRYGRGRLAVAREEAADPQVLAEDAQLLMSHRNDRLRVFNAGTGLFHYATSGDGRSGVLHAFLFPTPYRRPPMTVWFRQPWAEARTWMVDAKEAAPTGRAAVEPGVEFHLPPVPVYCALEVSA
jgi:hypothetical protein